MPAWRTDPDFAPNRSADAFRAVDLAQNGFL